MCCFSQAVLQVSGTQIFARPSQGTAQILVYSMSIQSEQEVSMILSNNPHPASANKIITPRSRRGFSARIPFSS